MIDDNEGFGGVDFDGATYERPLDQKRLATLLTRVHNVMSDGHWHSLEELVQRAGGTTASVSARLRDLRKAKFGGHTIQRRRVRDGLFLYSLPRLPKQKPLL